MALGCFGIGDFGEKKNSAAGVGPCLLCLLCLLYRECLFDALPVVWPMTACTWIFSRLFSSMFCMFASFFSCFPLSKWDFRYKWKDFLCSYTVQRTESSAAKHATLTVSRLAAR